MMVLLVVDTQRLITNKGLCEFELFKENVKRLIYAAREGGREVIYVRHEDEEMARGTEGFEIYDEFAPVKDERIFDKRANSAFKDTGLSEYLREKGETEIMVVGLQTDYCIDATVKCGFEHGFKIIVPEYANSTFDNEFMTAEKTYRYYNDFMWNGRYAKCVCMKEAQEMLKQ